MRCRKCGAVTTFDESGFCYNCWDAVMTDPSVKPEVKLQGRKDIMYKTVSERLARELALEHRLPYGWSIFPGGGWFVGGRDELRKAGVVEVVEPVTGRTSYALIPTAKEEVLP